MNFFSGRPNFASATRCVTRGGRGERSRGGSVSRVARDTRKEDANESVLGLEGALVAARARASRRLPRAARAAIARVPSRAFVRVGRCRIGTNRYDRRRSVLGVAAGTHELADATLVDEDGDGDAKDGEHAEVPRGEPEAALDDLAREPVRLDELVRHHVGGRAGAGHCAACGRGRGGGARPPPPPRAPAGRGGARGGAPRGPGEGRFGGRRGRAVRSRARPRGGRVGGRRGGRARAGRELSGAGGGAGRTLARSWTRCADAGRSDAARAGAARDGDAISSEGACGAASGDSVTRENGAPTHMCFQCQNFVTCEQRPWPAFWLLSVVVCFLGELRPPSSSRATTFAVPSRDSTARRDPGPGTPPPRLAAPWG